MKHLVFFGILSLLLNTQAFAGPTCSEVAKALGLTKQISSLGYSGALNIEDTTTKETVRIFVSQTGRFSSTTQDRYDFSSQGIMPVSNRGELFTMLNKRTNIQLIEIKGATNGCVVGFNSRQLGPNAVLITKDVENLGHGTVTLSWSATAELSSQLKITYHGPNMD